MINNKTYHEPEIKLSVEEKKHYMMLLHQMHKASGQTKEDLWSKKFTHVN